MICINDKEAFNAIAHAADAPYLPGRDWCIAKRNAEGVLLGGAMLTTFTGAGGSVQVHVAGFHPNWLDRVVLFAVFDMAFNWLQVGKVIAMISEHNAKSLKFNSHLGFRDECKIEGIFTFQGKPCAVVIRSMTRDQCRFLEPPRRLKNE